MMPTADTLVIDDLWQAIQPLLPTPPRRYDGRPRIDDRACLTGIVYQLRTGVPWRLLPTRQLGCGSPITCWRLRHWQRAGAYPALDPGFVALNRNEPAVRARSGGELAERVRRAEDYAVLGARMVVELHTESHASKPSTRPWPPSESPLTPPAGHRRRLHRRQRPVGYARSEVASERPVRSTIAR
jgi:transposase